MYFLSIAFQSTFILAPRCLSSPRQCLLAWLADAPSGRSKTKTEIKHSNRKPWETDPNIVKPLFLFGVEGVLRGLWSDYGVCRLAPDSWPQEECVKSIFQEATCKLGIHLALERSTGLMRRSREAVAAVAKT